MKYSVKHENSHIAFMFKNSYIASFRDIEEKIIGKMKLKTNLIPIPNDAPVEIPRLTAENDELKIHISAARFDIFFKNPTCLSESSIETKFEWLAKIVVSMSPVARIGCVYNYKIDNFDNNFILKNFRVQETIGIKESKIRINSNLDIDEQLKNLNNISILNYDKLNTKEGEILFQRDVNTNQNKVLDLRDSKKILEIVKKLSSFVKEYHCLITE